MNLINYFEIVISVSWLPLQNKRLQLQNTAFEMTTNPFVPWFKLLAKITLNLKICEGPDGLLISSLLQIAI